MPLWERPGTLRHQLTHLAAECYVWPEERIVFSQGRVGVEGAPERSVSLAELAAQAIAALAIIVGEMTPRPRSRRFTSFCAQVAEVEAIRRRGQVTVHRLVTAHDVGTIINPLDHQGQIDRRGHAGARVCPDGGAPRGRRAHHHAQFRRGEAPDDAGTSPPGHGAGGGPGGEGPYQGKAIGENPISPVAPAIANAVYDAVGCASRICPSRQKSASSLAIPSAWIKGALIGTNGMRNELVASFQECNAAPDDRRVQCRQNKACTPWQRVHRNAHDHRMCCSGAPALYWPHMHVLSASMSIG